MSVFYEQTGWIAGFVFAALYYLTFPVRELYIYYLIFCVGDVWVVGLYIANHSFFLSS